MTTGIPVFVGSTFVDLQSYRDAVRQALHRLEAVVRGMEYFGSLPGMPKDECLRIVRSCKVYIGIFAMRYGSVDETTGKSLTQLEYEEAQRIRLPSLIYLIDEDQQPILPKYIEHGTGAEKLQHLKTALRKNHVVSLFTTPEDLVAKITRDLPAVLERSGYEVREGELSKIVNSLPRISGFNDKHFSFLKREIGEAANKFPSDAILREAIEFLLVGDKLAASFLIARSTNLNLLDTVELLQDLEAKLRAVIERGYKIMELEGRAPVPPGLVKPAATSSL